MTDKDKKSREVDLPSGAKALIRDGKGRDLLAATRMAGGPNDPMRMVFGLLASLVTIDGRALTIEDVEDLPLPDVLKLQGEVMGNAGSLPAGTLPS